MKYTVYLLTPILIFPPIEASTKEEAERAAEKLLIGLPLDILDPEEPHRLVALQIQEEEEEVGK